ncbi:MAG: cell division protein SepF [Nitrososphaerota archaeon]|jgi:SepF-like predicted cell division protein (DUF552 family)|nr:cell division protein SepF [Nitrososphaerota archaeon]
MPSFGLFRKQKSQDTPVVEEQVAENAHEIQSEQLTKEESVVVAQESVVGDEGVVVSKEDDNVLAESSVVAGGDKLYLKAMPLRDTLDLEGIKEEVLDGNILILRITPLASKSIEAVKGAVNELYMFVESIGGDIARLGEERVVICPKNVRIWREKTPSKSEPLSASTVA